MPNRSLTVESTEEFKYLLHKESWQEILYTEVNSTFNVIMDTIIYFNTAFPLKTV